MSISKDISEKELLDRLKEGDHEAFEMLYHSHSPQLLLKLERKLPDTVDADEIIQELFIKIWDRRQQIDPERPFGGYLYRIAQRMLVDHYRKVARNTLLYKEIYDENSNGRNLTAEALDMKETQRLMEGAMQRLSPQQQRVFDLCKIQGKSYKQAAEIMGISAETVHVHLRKATQSVKAYLLAHQQHISGALAVALILSERFTQ